MSDHRKREYRAQLQRMLDRCVAADQERHDGLLLKKAEASLIGSETVIEIRPILREQQVVWQWRLQPGKDACPCSGEDQDPVEAILSAIQALRKCDTTDRS